MHGISTRAVDDVVKAMGGSGVSKSQVSRLCEETDERVNAFLSRPLEGAWPYLWIDATYLKVRAAGRVVSLAVIVAVGVNTDGRREMLGIATGTSEAEPFWKAFLRSLADRGLRGVKLVVADDHKGLRAAAAKVFSATHQRCRVHWLDERTRPRAGEAAPGGSRHAEDNLRPGQRRGRARPVAAGHRCASRALPQARRPHGRQRARRARLSGIPGAAPHQASLLG